MITQALSLLGGLFTLAPLAGLRTYLAAVGLLGLALHQFSVGAFDAAAQSLLAALAAFGVRSAIGRNAPQPEPPITIARLSPAAGLMAAIAGVAAIVLAVDGAGGVPQPGTAEVLAGETLIRLPPGELAPIDTGGISLLEQTPDWGHAAINVPDAWKQTRGRGARVAVLDTGVDAGHDDLRANVKRTLNTTNSSTSADRQGHGTHCAGIIAAADNDVGLVGVAPEAEIVSVKVLGDDGSGLGSWIAAGIDLAIAERVDVISMSLGSPGEDPRIKAAVTRAYAAGVIVVAAAGNDGPREGTIGYPGAQAECICVGASNRGGAVAQFSSRGARLDVVAPGEAVRSTYPGNRYATLSGTSMATPYVAGVAALYVSKTKAAGRTPSPAEFRGILTRTAVDWPPGGRDTASGFGLVQPVPVLDAVGTPATPPPATGTTITLGPEDLTAGGRDKLRAVNTALDGITFVFKK